MFTFFTTISVMVGIFFLFLAIKAYMGDNEFMKWVGYMILSFVIAFIFSCMSINTVPVSGTDHKQASKKEVKPVKKKTLYIKQEQVTYDKAKDTVVFSGKTNLNDGTEVGVGIEDKDTDETYGGGGKVKDGKFTVKMGEEYYLIENGNYEVSATVYVDTANNLKFPEKYGHYNTFHQNYKVLKGEIVPDGKHYNMGFYHLGKIKITNAHTKEEVEKYDESLKKQEEQERKQSAKTIRYGELEKNPDTFKGDFVKFQGQIVQIMEKDGSTDIRLAVTKASYGYDINDIVYVTYSGTTPFIKDDTVTVYGTIEGSLSYKSQAGFEITVPHLEAETVE
ncbi:hypothetical protein [Fictibacillus sp. KU28468]|uniref:hypothetical protein n=1 Tax=Fictibacillus sp. KU28468 TaxID=2991053 RepID=UPI00223D44E3|nr:hypothetical protein [Fictibacillus sp. KU28468]UZJ79330.1 hypothetical protein OKX00_02230 [Fictibacillus sp. KU28468]